ncbi:MAG: TadE family protein [Dehalococcoidia bacterium]
MEISLLLPLFLVIIIGVVEVADSFHSYITIVDAGRDGARLGSKNVGSDSDIVNLVLRETENLRDPVDAGDITIQHGTSDGVDAITVRVCTDRSLMLHVPLVMPDSFYMCSETTMRVLPGG